ncbi:tRNA pseudouridine synthase [Chlorociboria aeruginascens]|nr:tRNA pseudouridine synthase [Chlorociboria aeruginascens]
MSSTIKTGSGIVKPNQSNPSSMTSSNPSLLLDKFNGRRSTPDSEALASSDDEVDRQDHHQPVIPHKPTRRASWLNDTTQSGTQPRKGSFASSSMSPTTSHPSTPSAESGTWGTHAQATSSVGRGPPGTSSFPWGSGIWNPDSRKEPPSRLTEVLPSPTSLHSPGLPGNSYFANDSSSIQREPPANPTIPFAIPLHPTPKTYRSQSYSVGQLDPDSSASPASSGVSAFTGRGRPLQHSGLQHRPSRPSMLSEMSNDGGLGKVKEVEDDDDESTNGSAHGVQLQSNEAKTIELLARENAILRQQQYHNSRIRPRASTGNGFGLANGYGLQEPLPEESDYAIDELDEVTELQDIAAKGLPGRRMSEYGAGQARVSPYVSLENRKLENVKKAYWQSSLGFGGLGDIPQSRRHSFADIPARQGSVSSVGEPLSAHESTAHDAMSPKEYQGRYQDAASYSLNEHAVSYFGVVPTRNVEAYASTNYQPSVYPYGIASQYSGGRPTSPHRGMYGAPQPRHNQLLYIVLFKCSRADVFYVQEGTGLSVKPGDLVIVEADRGTDLGTVARDNVDWASAKDLKEHYAEEHYKWLMMYSQGAAGNTDGTGAGLMAAANGMQGSAVGGMGPPSQHGMQEPNPAEIKPKIIKRLAQNHEVQALRDKEGNEAKAKRVCMQKVKEHGLHMEILDAEFQMDWKKLTFYYFADAYINFNSLVTDLFKVYKTRIWMSAINPASFASPSLGLQAPSGIGPGAVGVSRNTQNERRPQQSDQPAYAIPQAGRGYQGIFPQSFSSSQDRVQIPPTAFPPSGFTYGYSQFGNPPRNTAVSSTGYNSNIVDPYAGFTNSADYQGPARFPSPHNVTPTHDASDYIRQGNNLVAPSDSWILNPSFHLHGLSKNQLFAFSPAQELELLHANCRRAKMARASNKRKSEVVLPNAARQWGNTAPTRGYVSDTSERDYETGGQLVVDDQPVAKPALESTKNRMSESPPLPRTDEYDEDAGRMESQQFLALVAAESKKKRRAVKEAAEYLERFAQLVETDDRDLKKHLHDLETSAKEQDNGFLEAFEIPLVSIYSSRWLDSGKDGDNEGSTPHFSSAYKRSQNLTACALRLIEKFDRVIEQISTDASNSTEYPWAEEDNKMAKLLTAGKAAGLSNIESLLTGSREPVLDAEATRDSSTFYQNRDEYAAVGWGRIARKQEKALKKVIRGISA